MVPGRISESKESFPHELQFYALFELHQHVDVIQTMRKIVIRVENSPLIRKYDQAPQNKNDRFVTKSTCYHAALMATEIEAKAICTLTNSGYMYPLFVKVQMAFASISVAMRAAW